MPESVLFQRKTRIWVCAKSSRRVAARKFRKIQTSSLCIAWFTDNLSSPKRCQ